MSVALNLLIVVAAVAFPFVMMPILWRRMRRVQRQVLHGQEKDSAPRSGRRAIPAMAGSRSRAAAPRPRN